LHKKEINMRLSRSALVLALIMGTLGVLWGVEPNTAGAPALKRPSITRLPKIPAEVKDALQSRDFATAVKLIDAALTLQLEVADAALTTVVPTAAPTDATAGTGLQDQKPADRPPVAEVKVPQPSGTPTDYLLYLKGRALTELDSLDPAIATFLKLEKDFPKSAWYSRSRFGQAAVLVKKRDYQAAGAIYKAEAERLLSAGRRDELTAIYLEFADHYFDGCPAVGPKPKCDPDYAQAINYYQQALQLHPGLALQQRIELRIARCHQELKQFKEALAAYQKFLNSYAQPTTPRVKQAAAALAVEAQFQLGQVQLDMGQPAEARKTWQDFLNSESAKEAGGPLLAEASYRLARTHGIPQPPTIGDLELGVELLDQFVKKYPQHPLTAEAEYNRAQSYLHHSRHEQAIVVLKGLIANPQFAKAPQVARAWNLLGQSYRAQKKFDAAIEAWRSFLEKFPTDPEWSNVQRLIVDTEFDAAEELRNQKMFAAARKAWETFLNKYPLDVRAPLILVQFGQMQIDEAQQITAAVKPPAKPTDEQQTQVTKLLTAALEDWQRLVSKYPASNEASQASYLIGLTYESRLGKLQEAVDAYRKVQGQFANAAQQRLALLISPQLEIITERKFRSTEKPTIKVSTRNLKNVSVKLYRVDLTDYFRKLHLASGVESLDIALIDPDKSFEHSVPEYQEYRRLDQAIEIPVEGAGVTAVTVSSDKLEATTMVVVSDIDIIVKSSRNELFVFAENMLTGKPAEGVKLLVSDSSKVFAEEVTGKDGILQKKFEELKTVSDLRVFGFVEQHAASSQISLEGLQFAVGLSAKGYLYTDRPAYSAGQLVNVKGIIRWVADDRYTFKVGEKYQLDVYDAQGRVIHTQDVALGDFGTFAANWQLPEQAQAGQYRVHVFQPGRDQSYEMNFLVQEYQLEPIQFSVELPQKVYYRGEPVKGKLVLKYYYGSPIAGRSIQYRLGDDRLWTATTDAKGEVAFELPTQRYSEAQPVQFVASFPERNLSTGETIFLATRGYAVAVSTVRDVYVTGESFDASMAVNDPSGKPVATDLNFELIEVTQTPTGTGERRVSEQAVKSDAKTGLVRHTLRVEKPGRFILRSTGQDRFGHTVSGSKEIIISGQDDEIRLRILADQHNYHAGDKGRVQLHWREQPALALITFEGATILAYQLLELKPGSNPLEIDFQEHLAPNFQLSVAVMQGNKYHEARSDFRVARELFLTVKPAKTTLKPGEAVPVEVIVTDAQGKPVQTELSLGLIQKNLLQRFPDGSATISTFFNGGDRQISCRAMTSCAFKYQPATRPINEFLLAEVDREKNAEAEKKSKLNIAADAVPGDKGTIMLGGIVNGAVQPAYGRASRALNRGDKKEFSDQLAEQQREQAAVPQSLPELQKQIEENSELDQQPNRPRRRGFSALSEDLAGVNANSGRQIWFDNANTVTNTIDAHDFIAATVPWARLDRPGPMVDGPGPGVVQLFPLSEVNNSLSWFDSSNKAKLYANGDDANWGIQILANSQTPLFAINHYGELQVVNGRSVTELKKLAESGMVLITAQKAAETGYWNPLLVTDAKGKATTQMVLPDRSTAWVIRARGINKIALAGQAEAEIVTKEELFAELQTPMAFVIGDKSEVLVEVHNTVLKDAKIEVKLKTTIGDATTELKKVIDVKEPGVSEVSFPVTITAGEQAEFELTVSSGEFKDVVQRGVQIEPDGIPVQATAGGTSAQNTSFQIKFPDPIKAQNPSLELFIGPSINRTLLEAVLGGSTGIWERSTYAPKSNIERAVSDVLGGVSLLKMLGQSRNSNAPEARELAGRIQAGLALLISTQREDGGWSWAGVTKATVSDRYLTSRVAWAFADARKSGFAVPQQTFDKGIQFLNTAYASSTDDDHENRAIILHGLAEAGHCDFAHLNRLHRLRNSLNASAQVHLALSLIAMDRKPMALEILTLAKEKLLPLPVNPVAGGLLAADKGLTGCMPWMHSGVEVRGLYLMAVNATTPAAAGSDEIAKWLLGARLGSRWQPEKANGPVIVALADWFGRAKLVPEKYTLSVFVNNKLVTKLAVDPSVQPNAMLPIPAKFLGPLDKPQQVNLDIEGRGQFSYSAILTGFVPTESVVSTADANFVCQRNYEPAHRMLDGETIPRGFGHLNHPFDTFSSPFTQVPVGERGEVTISIWRHNVSNAANEHRDYLVYTEPLPSGVSVLTETIRGKFERYEIGANSITFYLGDAAYPEQIHFDIVGYVPGTYKRRPGVVRSFYDPAKFVVAKAEPLTVLPRGVASKDEYRLTPEEDYEFGKRFFTKGDFARADIHLSRLFKKYKLSDIYPEVVQMLFQTSLEAKRHADVVQYFEIIKEKLPDVEISFEHILKVADAYREIGEYERSYLVFRATLEAGFQRESQIAGFLDERGEFLRSVEVMEQLLWSYPAESYVATATYALAQEVYGKATEAAQNEKLKAVAITRVDLVAASAEMLDHFLATWATDPAADQASFSLANALLDLERYPEVVARCTAFAKRYPDSKLLDSFWYVIGYSEFAQGLNKEALEMCRKVADWKLVDAQTKAETPAANRWQAIYIMGQIYHSLGQAAFAIAEYDKVKDHFPDAREAIDFFSRKDLVLPEVTTVKPGAAGKVTLKYRNVTGATIKVYRIDLLKFGLLNRNLSRITAINLAGIRPYHDLTVKLGDGKDYRDKEHELELPLKDEGAYLVVCQGDNLYTSGLVLVSPLILEIQEDAPSGRVRVTVKDVVAEKYAHAVHVKVIGSSNAQFQSGQTDLRGIFVADNIQGTSTVIAKTGANRYAFYRGKMPLGPPPAAANAPAQAAQPASKPEGKDSLLDGLRMQNQGINQIQRDNYRGLLKNSTQGIKAKGAF
jgi:tetratricopeptide (TPR) repeat protein